MGVHVWNMVQCESMKRHGTYKVVCDRHASDEQWHAARQHYVGASDTPALLSEANIKKKTPFGPQFHGNDTTKLGHLLEDDIITLANEAKGFVARSSVKSRFAEYHISSAGVMLASETYTTMSCSPDAWCLTPKTAARRDRFARYLGEELGWVPAAVEEAMDYHHLCILELKTVGPNSEKYWGAEYSEVYWEQVQHQLAVTGLEVGWLLGLLLAPRKLIAFRFKRDQDFIDSRAKLCQTYMEKAKEYNDRHPF